MNSELLNYIMILKESYMLNYSGQWFVWKFQQEKYLNHNQEERREEGRDQSGDNINSLRISNWRQIAECSSVWNNLLNETKADIRL